jgi:hypothetical protein
MNERRPVSSTRKAMQDLASAAPDDNARARWRAAENRSHVTISARGVPIRAGAIHALGAALECVDRQGLMLPASGGRALALRTARCHFPSPPTETRLMVCLKCKAEMSPAARFCPSCASPNPLDGDAKAPQEVTLSWLESVYQGLGYETKVEAASLTARHKERASIWLSIQGNKFLGLNSFWKLSKPPGMLAKGAFTEAVNKANSNSFVVMFSWPSNKQDVIQTSARDIAEFTDTYQQLTLHLFELSGLRAFA